MPPLLRNARVIDDPGQNPTSLLHGGQNPAAHFGQHRLVAPRRLRHSRVHRLPGRLYAVWMQPCRHRLDALALVGQQQSLAVVFQRLVPVSVPGGQGPSLPNRLAGAPRGLGPERADRTKQLHHKMFLF